MYPAIPPIMVSTSMISPTIIFRGIFFDGVDLRGGFSGGSEVSNVGEFDVSFLESVIPVLIEESGCCLFCKSIIQFTPSNSRNGFI
jgi:hypothetical protein